MITLDSSDKNLKIGATFTPLKWAEFAIEEFDLLEKWLSGKSIFDPTCGCGNLFFALIEKALNKGYKAKDLPINQLYGVELNSKFFDSIFITAKEKFGIKLLQKNFLNQDIFFLENEPVFDIIFGNPPWQNFTDLPACYKEKIKEKFLAFDLVDNPKTLLLGGSRIDIAALVLQKTIQKNLTNDGEAIFFIPLSLLLNDGAHKFFRTYKIHETNFQINKVFDFNNLKIFDDVATRYGLICLKRDSEQKFPINYKRWEDGQWINCLAKPLFTTTDPLSIFRKSDSCQNIQIKPITVKQHSQPRQGVNACGANHIFSFENFEDIDEKTCEVSNQRIRAILPKKYVYPLISNHNFDHDSLLPKKWIFLPYNNNGKPLSWAQIASDKHLLFYLKQHQNLLQNRKGVMLNSWIKKGVWWALLGVGDYNFYPFKITWPAYGKNVFKPKIFPQNWQANQSLQAFIPVLDFDEAKRIMLKLQDVEIENYLLSLKMDGTMNWAQPGKIKKLLKFENSSPDLFTQQSS